MTAFYTPFKSNPILPYENAIVRIPLKVNLNLLLLLPTSNSFFVLFVCRKDTGKIVFFPLSPLVTSLASFILTLASY